MSEATALSEAKQVLLSALDSINEIEQEMDAEVRHRRGADAIEDATEPAEDDED